MILTIKDDNKVDVLEVCKMQCQCSRRLNKMQMIAPFRMGTREFPVDPQMKLGLHDY